MMFRYNNPDALLALLLTAATYATMRGLERAQTKWLVLAGALIGFGFITKMLQAFLILPVLAVVYLLAAPTGWWRRVWQTFLMGVSVLVAAGWWVAIVALTPAADRPYVGGSQNNSILNLIFGYNGFGRLDGNESGSVGGGRVAGSMWGPTGLTRLFNTEFGNMMSWLLPGALVMGAVLLVVTLRARRTDRERAALLLWGGSLVSIGLVISLAQGIIHPYYTVALAPPLGALVGIATMGLWQRRASWVGRAGLAAGLAATVVWSYILLGRTSDWFPALRPFVLVVGALGVVAILALPLLRNIPKVAIALVATLGFGAALAAPLFSTVATAATPHTGAIPSVTPTPAGGVGGPGGGFAGGAGGGFPGRRHSVGPSAAARGPAASPRAAASPERAPSGRCGCRRRCWCGCRSRAERPRSVAEVASAEQRVPAVSVAWRWRWRWRRVLELQSVQRGIEQGAADRRRQVHLGGGHGELEQRCRLPAGQRRARDGHRRVQRHRPCADAVPVREVRLGRQDPLLHRQRRRIRRRRLRRRWFRRRGSELRRRRDRRSRPGWRRTSPPRPWAA